MGARLGILALTAAAALGAAAFMAALPGIVHADTRYVSFPVSYYRLVQSGVTTYSNQVVGYRLGLRQTRPVRRGGRHGRKVFQPVAEDGAGWGGAGFYGVNDDGGFKAHQLF